jgi:hypothetical protein
MENTQISIESNLQGLLALPEGASHHLEMPTGLGFNTDADTHIFIRFRVAEAGDASPLANLFSKANTQSDANTNHTLDEVDEIHQPPAIEDVNSLGNPKVAAANDLSYLEINIASGLGDEQTPPAFHAIIAEIINCPSPSPSPSKDDEATSPCSKGEREATGSPSSIKLCGAAISTVDWDSQQSRRYLRVQEIAVDKSLVPDVNLLLRRFVLSLSALALKTACAGMLLEEHLVEQLKEGSELKHSIGELRPQLPS